MIRSYNFNNIEDWIIEDVLPVEKPIKTVFLRLNVGNVSTFADYDSEEETTPIIKWLSLGQYRELYMKKGTIII